MREAVVIITLCLIALVVQIAYFFHVKNNAYVFDVSEKEQRDRLKQILETEIPSTDRYFINYLLSIKKWEKVDFNNCDYFVKKYLIK